MNIGGCNPSNLKKNAIQSEWDKTLNQNNNKLQIHPQEQLNSFNNQEFNFEEEESEDDREILNKNNQEQVFFEFKGMSQTGTIESDL